MTPRKSTKTEPQILDMPHQKMAVLQGRGAPDKVFAGVMPLLFGSVYALKFGLKKEGLETFKVLPPRARYPDANAVPREEWTIIVGIPIPDDTVSLPQKVGDSIVRIDTWRYGPVAQILHLGPYDQEGPTIERLVRYIEENGYEIDGAHEEEYLSKPESKVVKTIIRFPIRKK